ncbi:ArsR/SmtB family transcription factor [Methanocella arvoryzae]|uniref:Transcription regulator (ArsR family) n=1 Tax=Methanocella arvoryzae (strain DSM 22066 / NBRC 105507 / MRE50) TaxID=351160 RepID=Q0W191_METAR|nr:metalloregulator ArsR/SmtB family transcription factor [Methanocella arvoryzae]CAJ37852.1 putative transcription regulator (ArsR family) [Methanocella arvoryzae MRE50]
MAGHPDSTNDYDSCEATQVHEGSVSRARARAIDEETVQRLSDIFKVMGDPTRLRIINALSAGEMCVCDIACALGMENSAISHQLRILKAMRLVKFRKEGKSAIYSLDDEHMLTLFNEGLKHAQHR